MSSNMNFQEINSFDIEGKRIPIRNNGNLEIPTNAETITGHRIFTDSTGRTINHDYDFVPVSAPALYGIIRNLRHKITDIGVWHFGDCNLLEIWYIERDLWQTPECLRISDSAAHELLTFYCGNFENNCHNWKEDGF